MTTNYNENKTQDDDDNAANNSNGLEGVYFIVQQESNSNLFLWQGKR